MTAPTTRPWKCVELPQTHSLAICNAMGWEICRFYSVAPIDRANAELIVTAINSWDSADALRTRIHALSQFSTVDSIDSPQPEVT